jgi:hypothetical protein
VLKLLSEAPSLASFVKTGITDRMPLLEKHLKASLSSRNSGKAIRAQLLEEQQATLAMAAAAARGLQLVGQAGTEGVLAAEPFSLAVVARMCSNLPT